MVGSEKIAISAGAGDWRRSAGQRNPEKSGAAGIRTDRDRGSGQDRRVESFAQHFVSQQRRWFVQGGGGSEKCLALAPNVQVKPLVANVVQDCGLGIFAWSD